MVKYSICATHYNNRSYLPKSAGTLCELISGKEEWEFVLTDANSTDGSLEYLRRLDDEYDNFRLIIEDNMNIGEGRDIAAREARGDILGQVPDMDAEYYEDSRLFDIVSYYEDLIEDEGEVMLNVIGGYIITSDLLERMGGWNGIPVAEERGLSRRLLREDRLRFCDVRLFVRNEGHDKVLIDAVRRLYKNAVVKMASGASFWWILLVWLRRTESIKPKIGASILFPIAYLDQRFRRDISLSTYDTHDEYLIHFRETVREKNPEIWYTPPEELEEYT